MGRRCHLHAENPYGVPNQEPFCCEAAPLCLSRVTSPKSFKPWNHFAPITFYWTININQPQCHTAALRLKAVGNKLYRLFTGHSSDCLSAWGTGWGGNAIRFHTTLPHNKGTQLRRTIFPLQRSILFHSWETAGFIPGAGGKIS